MSFNMQDRLTSKAVDVRIFLQINRQFVTILSINKTTEKDGRICAIFICFACGHVLKRENNARKDQRRV